jgi:serine protease SohB
MCCALCRTQDHFVARYHFFSNQGKQPPKHPRFQSLNEYYVKDGMALQKAIRKRHSGLKWPSSPTLSIGSHFASSKSDSRNKNKTGTKPTADTTEDNGKIVVILDWTKLDEQITSMNQLRQQIGFLLSEYRGLVMEGEQATNNVTMGNDDDHSDDSESSSPATALEVVVLLESPGGSVSEYGLAGQHLLRLRNEPGITLTICVDKVAASGGYLLCCTASPGKLFAAPFALLGSIGVIATTINVNRLLTNWGIQPLEFRGGKYKAPIGMIGRVSKAGKRVTQTMIDDIHGAFKQHVVNARPILKNKIEEIGNGSVWLGVDAIDLGLVDSIKTSDEYIEEMVRDGTRVFKMVQAPRTGLLFGPRIGAFNTIDSKIPPAMKGPSTSTSTQEDVVEGLIQKSKTMMLRLPAHAKSMFSKSLQSFQ